MRVNQLLISITLPLLAGSAALAQTPAPIAAPSPAPTAPFVDPSPFIGGVKLHTTDLEKSIKFYQTVFGMKYFNNNAAGSTRQVMLGFPELQPGPHQPPNTVAEPIIVLMHDPNFVHVKTTMADFFVRVLDVAAVKKRAADAGYPVPETGNILTDPSGNMIEVAVMHYFRSSP
jgi:predicted enzyme related to lactoylglutathione lyase